MKKKTGILFIAAVLLFLFTGCGKEMSSQTLGTGMAEASQSTQKVEDSAKPDTQDQMVQVSESQKESEMIEQTPQEPVSEAIPVVQTITITATGDCALGPIQLHGYSGSFNEYYDKYGEAYFFEEFRDIFSNDDLTLINLECVLTNATNRVEKTYNIKGKPEYTGIMTSSSVEAVSLGNNHSSDYGPESLADTKRVLEEAGIVYAINDTISYYTTEDGLVVAMVSASVTAWGNERERYLLDGVKEARAQGADLVVACCHWGIEKENYPNSYQTNLGHQLIDAGADLIIGNHPHVLQGMEAYKGKVICYSLGNFSFGANMNPKDKNTVVYQQTFTFIDGVLQPEVDAKIIPSRISGLNNANNFQPIIAQGEQAASIIKNMNQYSAPYGSVSFDDAGILILTEE